MVKRCAGSDDGLLIFAKRPGESQCRIEILALGLGPFQIRTNQRRQVSRKIRQVRVEDLALPRPAETVVERKALGHLPRILCVEANVVVCKDLLVTVRRRLTRIAESYGHRAGHRELKQLLKSRTWSGPAGLQACRQRGVDCWRRCGNRCWRERCIGPVRILIPRSMTVLHFVVAAETYSVGSLGPAHVVGELIRARVAVLGDVNVGASNQPAEIRNGRTVYTKAHRRVATVEAHALLKSRLAQPVPEVGVREPEVVDYRRL